MNPKACKSIDRYHFPSTRELLIHGGDTRIIGNFGCNEYGCRPWPDPDLVSFSSSTASTISQSAFAAAALLRKKIEGEPTATTCKREFSRIRQKIISLYNLEDLTDLKILFAASGTDAHLIASRLISPDHIIMVGHCETGRGVPTALAGKHFSTRSSFAHSLKKGGALSRGTIAKVSEINIRYNDGTIRPSNDIDDEISKRVRMLVNNGLRVLLVLVDVSKTGLIAPSPACAIRLKNMFGQSLDILVDACQFRISSTTLRAYLSREFLVAVTGSKFITGPAFSGALLIPGAVQTRSSYRGLSAYCSKCEWPDDLISGTLGSGTNFGLLLRWEAALAELRQFSKIKESDVKRFLTTFNTAILSRLEKDPHIRPLTVPPLVRDVISDSESWDHVQTIFPFLVTNNGAILDNQETRRIHILLQKDLSSRSQHPLASLRCLLGQPVAVGSGQSALRLCTSARLVAKQEDMDAAVHQATAVLDKIALILKL